MKYFLNSVFFNIAQSERHSPRRVTHQPIRTPHLPFVHNPRHSANILETFTHILITPGFANESE